MVLSYYSNYPLYNFIWWILKIFRHQKKIVLYCEDAFDWELFRNVGKYLPPISIIAKNRRVQKQLKKLGCINVGIMPSYPDVVIMFRTMAWKFPCSKIIKIGFKHGAFNFKAHSKAKYYDLFNVFFLTSSAEVKRVQQLGVKTKLYAEYPKIDTLFVNGVLAPLVKPSIKKPITTLLFTATWDGSGMSAINKWYDQFSTLKEKYRILVTVHEWTSFKYIKVLKENKELFFIDEYDRLKYIQQTDICIVDTSSIIAECCLLDRPLIAFRTSETKRTLPEIRDLIAKIALSVDSFGELEQAIKTYQQNPTLLAKERKEAAELFFGSPDGQAGRRAADIIKQYC